MEHVNRNACTLNDRPCWVVEIPRCRKVLLSLVPKSTCVHKNLLDFVDVIKHQDTFGDKAIGVHAQQFALHENCLLI